MALFKINRGSEKNLPTGITDGYAYFCTDNQNFYIDFIDSGGVSTRKKLGVEFAEKLRYLKDGAYVEIDPTTLVVKTDLDNVAKLDEDNTFTGNIKIDAARGNFIGNLQGTADKATSDASGNNIESTYLKKVDTSTFLKSITGYDASKVQILSHDASGNIAWINSIDTLLI